MAHELLVVHIDSSIPSNFAVSSMYYGKSILSQAAYIVNIFYQRAE